jgi:hypothetical protein
LVVQKSLASDLSSLAPPQTEDASDYGSGLTSYVEVTEESLETFQTTDGYVQVSLMNWGVNPFPNSSDVDSALMRLQVTTDLPLPSRRRTQEILRNGSTPGFYVTMQFSTVQNFNFTLTLDEAFAVGASNITYPQCNYYANGGYIPCDGCWVTTYTNYNVTYGCPLEFLAQMGSSGRRLQSETGGAQSVNFGVIMTSVESQFVNTISRNPFNVNWQKAKAVVGFLGTLTFIIILGFWYFRRWDITDKGFLVYAKPETDRREFENKHQALLEVYKSEHSHHRPSWQDTNRKRRTTIADTFLSVVRPASSTHTRPEPPQRVSSNMLMTHSAAPGAHNKNTLINALAGANSAKHNSHAQYEALFEKATNASGERALYVSNVVANFLDSVMPEDSLEKNSHTTWAMFIHTVLRYHEYTAMFFGSSLKFTRTLRWTNIVLGFLLNLFFDTLFYGIFYPDEGTCEVYTTEDSCLHEQSQISTSRLCVWTLNTDTPAATDGTCALNPPPQSFVFLIIVVLCTVVISVPIQFSYDLLLFQLCMRRPRFEDWGLTSEYWIGRSTHNLSGKKEAQVSPIQELYSQVDYERQSGGYEHAVHSDASKAQHILADNNFKARTIYDSHMSADYEANKLLAEVKDFLDVHVNAPKVPWQNSKFSVVTQAKANAIQKYIGIYPDGRPVPLSVVDYLLYGTPKKKLNAGIERARAKSEQIQHRLKEFGNGELQNRDTMLIQFFILEQFSAFKQFVLHRHMFDFNVSTPGPISPFLWIFAWAFILLSILFFLYWGFIWGVNQAGHTVANWGINIGTSLAQDVFVVQVFRVYIIYSLSMISIKPQLQFIYRVLAKVAISYAQDELVDDFLDVRVCQHLSPACRAAHSHVASNLATGTILRHIDDADVAVCRLKYDVSMATIATAAFTLPLLIAIVNEAAGDVFMDSLFPAVLDATLIMNYYFFAAAGLFIMMPYLVAITVYLWKHKVHKPSRKMLQARRRGESTAMFVKRWNAANRVRTGQSTLAFLQERLVLGAYYLTRPVQVYRAVHDWLYGTTDPVSDLQWTNMNRPAPVQGLECTEPLPTPDYSFAGRVVETQADEAMKLIITERIPPEVESILCVAKIDWVKAWRQETAVKDKPGQSDGGYASNLLARALMNVHQPGLQPMVPRALPPEPVQHSEAVYEFLDSNNIITTADGAVAHILHCYRKHVIHHAMSLVDPEEEHDLFEKDYTKCNVLIEFSDLRIVLEEVLNVYQPHHLSLSLEERDEVVESCYAWLTKHGDMFLDEHYNHDANKVAQATLARLVSSSAVDVGTGAGGSTAVTAGAYSTNFSVPFQKFRRWFLTTAAAINRFREAQTSLDDALGIRMDDLNLYER